MAVVPCTNCYAKISCGNGNNCYSAMMRRYASRENIRRNNMHSSRDEPRRYPVFGLLIHHGRFLCCTVIVRVLFTCTRRHAARDWAQKLLRCRRDNRQIGGHIETYCRFNFVIHWSYSTCMGPRVYRDYRSGKREHNDYASPRPYFRNGSICPWGLR